MAHAMVGIAQSLAISLFSRDYTLHLPQPVHSHIIHLVPLFPVLRLSRACCFLRYKPVPTLPPTYAFLSLSSSRPFLLRIFINLKTTYSILFMYNIIINISNASLHHFFHLHHCAAARSFAVVRTALFLYRCVLDLTRSSNTCW